MKERNKEMIELENLKMSDVLNYLADKVTEDFEVNKSLAKKLVINALLYNVVIEEIENQIRFLIDEE